MYKDFYHFQQDPFNITPDPDLFYISKTHREALAQLIYGINAKKGIIAIIGEVGVGKTTVINTFFKKIEKENVITAFVFNPKLELLDFFHLISDELGLPKPSSKAEFLINLNKFLIDCHAKGKGPVVIVIDEAQNLSDQLLEEIRLLLNLETAKEKLLQIVLSGQPELWERLKAPHLRQLRQRISFRHTIEPLDKSETEEYIKERLKSAGGDEDIFTARAISEIYKYSKGIPRLINIICHNALITGYALDKKVIDPKIIREVVQSSAIGYKASRAKKNLRWIAAAIATLFIIFIPLQLKDNFSRWSKKDNNHLLSTQNQVLKKSVERNKPTLKIGKEGLLYSLFEKYGFINNDLFEMVKKLNPSLKDLYNLPPGTIITLPPSFNFKNGGLYAVHIITTSDFSKAKQFFISLMEKGHKALVYILKEQEKYQVVIGNYRTFDEAKTVADSLVNQGRLSKSIVIRIPQL